MQTKSILIDSNGRYTRPAIALHWLLALLIPIQAGLGWYMLSVEDQPGSARYFSLHISFGLTIALLVLLRLAWRARHPPHPLPATVAPWEMKSARLSHLLLYILMILLPLSGYLGASLSGDVVSFFGIVLPSWLAKNESLKEQFFGAHSVVAWMLTILVAIHLLAAVKHLTKDKDGVFWRMWPR